MKERRLGVVSVALMCTGTLMGAGFASGREIWQFFGVFGEDGAKGLVITGILFVLVSAMTGVIARFKGSNDMGRVVVPFESRRLESATGWFMAAMLYIVLVVLSAAGGSLLSQQTGLPGAAGGAAVAALVAFTVLGGFHRVSGVFRILMPLLVTALVAVCIMTLTMSLAPAWERAAPAPSPLAPDSLLSAVVYASYNILAIIPIAATAAVNAKSTAHAVAGSALGGVFLFVLAFLLYMAVSVDRGFSQAMDMPMLGYTARISAPVNIIFTFVLMFAIYASAASNFYGFTTKLKETPHKRKKIIAAAAAGFLLGLMGFKNAVAVLLPAEGFVGIIIIIMLTWNFLLVMKKKKEGTLMKEGKKLNTPEDIDLFDIFEGFDRFAFPGNIHRVTGGHGGEALLIAGTEKTALLDCGMAFCGKITVENTKRVLSEQGRENLDMVFLSHSHYDHIGALPFIRKAFPETVVYGSAHCRDILVRPNARRLMKDLGTSARDLYMPESKEEIPTDGLEVDVVLKDGDAVSLGKETVRAMETKGHTDCSMSYALEPLRLLFTSESTGLLEAADYVHTPVLKSFGDAVASAEKCRKYDASYICLPHFGMIPENMNRKYWDMLEEAIDEKLGFIASMKKEGLSEEEMLERYAERYWTPEKEKEQPKEAYMINSASVIKAALRYLED